MEKILEYSKNIINKHLNNETIAVDATCGRGNDTLFLAKKAKIVYAFDIQDEAIDDTKNLTHMFNNVCVIKDSHENIFNYVKTNIDIVMFNLGYLPKSDKSITTHYDSTINALKEILPRLNLNGIVTITVYPGHLEGAKESLNLTTYLQDIDQKKYDIVKYEFVNQINNPPYVFIIERIRL